MRYLLALLLLLICIAPKAQETGTACRTRISVITCSPGSELYALFGHTALRLQDSAVGSDYVFNYGAFEFSDPNFYVKFVRGKLPYFLSVETYEQFMAVYRWEQRHVWEQPLPLDCAQKQQLLEALSINLQPQNRYYAYDFFFDNCTTRIRDLLAKYAGATTQSLRIIPPGTTFRQQIHQYLDGGHQPWSKLGIDLLLGLPCDAVSSQWQAQFLPLQLMKAIELKGSGLAVTPAFLYQADTPVPTGLNAAPLLVMSAVAALVLALLYWPNRRAQRIGFGLYGVLLFIMGLLGCLLVFMWLGTDHQICRQNLNLLWAWPTHAVAAFLLRNGRLVWMRYYLLAIIITQSLLLAVFFFLPQALNTALIPLVMLLAAGAYRLLQTPAYAKGSHPSA